MVLFAKENYKYLRELIKGKDYESIYGALLKEVANIKKTGVSVKNTSGLKLYVENETRELIFAGSGLPTYLIKIIILMGPEFENEVVKKITSYLTTNYTTEFQSFASKNFKGLTSIGLLYKQLDNVIKNFKNKFFNLPPEWFVFSEIIRTLYLLMKQKLCDVFYFEKIQESEYVDAFTVILSEERKFTKYILQPKSPVDDENISKDKESNIKIDFYSLNEDPYAFMIFKLFLPYFELYLKSYFKEFDKVDYDVKNNEMQIISIFLSFFRSFEKLYKKVSVFENDKANTLLLNYLFDKLSYMVRQCNAQICNQLDVIQKLDDINKENKRLNNRDILERVIVVLNTSAYIYDYVCDFCSMLHRDEQSDSFYNCLGILEKNFTCYLSTYVTSIFSNISFDKTGFYIDVISSLENFIFVFPVEELYPEVMNLVIESIIIHILSNLYLLDFDVDKAEVYLCEIGEIKEYLSRFCKNIPMFSILESYIKIFLCPVQDIPRFVDNFMLLSNGIFSFNQIISSLTLTSTIEELKEEYLQRKENETSHSANEDAI